MKNLIIALALFLLPISTLSGELNMTKINAHQFSFTDIDGKEMPLSKFSGKTLLIVNTASECGYTKQLADMETLWGKYKDQGLVVIGVPSNDFGGQEPGAEAEIKAFCTKNFKVSFPLTSKTIVKGKEAHPFYKWAAEKTSFLGTPKWNFHKYLISPEGEFVDYFSTPTSPTSTKITGAIEKLIK